MEDLNKLLDIAKEAAILGGDFLANSIDEDLKILHTFPADENDTDNNKEKGGNKFHFNSFDAFAHCFTNLSVMMMLNNEY